MKTDIRDNIPAWPGMIAIVILLVIASTMSGCTITKPVTATGQPIGNTTGQSTATTVLGITVAGDASIRTAAANGGISQVSTVDFREFNLLWVFQRRTCIVTGK